MGKPLKATPFRAGLRSTHLLLRWFPFTLSFCPPIAICHLFPIISVLGVSLAHSTVFPRQEYHRATFFVGRKIFVLMGFHFLACMRAFEKFSHYSHLSFPPSPPRDPHSRSSLLKHAISPALLTNAPLGFSWQFARFCPLPRGERSL